MQFKKTVLLIILFLLLGFVCIAENKVQPFTGLVFWEDNYSCNNSEAISLEFFYASYSDIVKEKNKYDWSIIENKLNNISERNHQAILRFRYTEPGSKSFVPEYIKKSKKYKSKKGRSEGKKTWFPDWRSRELENFTIEFYTKLAEKYDNDPRLAYIQAGFGLWGEYHIYDGPKIIGRTFPSKSFQTRFLKHLDKIFVNTPWSISIDAADSEYSPIKENPELLKLNFGLFDDSFMHKEHDKYNLSSFNFFGKNRYKKNIAGGELSYLKNYDQIHALDFKGPYGKSFKKFAEEFHITYMLANDQPEYQTIETIKKASLVCGYKFELISFERNKSNSIVEIRNTGIAPIYFDAYISINKKKAEKNLRMLMPGMTQIYTIPETGEAEDLEILCSKLLETQKIDIKNKGR